MTGTVPTRASNSRLSLLIALNTENEKRRRMFANRDDARAVALMRNPLKSEKALAMFGLLLGISPPAALFIKFLIAGSVPWWFAGFFIIANCLTAIAGYYSGVLVGTIVRLAEEKDWITMIFFLFFMGSAWGAFCG